jgi:hypothetical protein
MTRQEKSELPSADLPVQPMQPKRRIRLVWAVVAAMVALLLALPIYETRQHRGVRQPLGVSGAATAGLSPGPPAATAATVAGLAKQPVNDPSAAEGPDLNSNSATDPMPANGPARFPRTDALGATAEPRRSAKARPALPSIAPTRKESGAGSKSECEAPFFIDERGIKKLMPECI